MPLIPLSKIQSDYKDIKLNRLDPYILSYPYFIDFFKSADRLELRHLVQGSYMVYGWMPTIPKIDLRNEKLVLNYLNGVKKGKLLTIDQLKELQSSINNSVVGVSKLLHFINPSIYAIWDSRIFRYMNGKKPSSQIKNPKNYLAYLKFLEAKTLESGFSSFHNSVNNDLGYEVSGFRALELVMFEADKLV